jgi:hypothetical protein
VTLPRREASISSSIRARRPAVCKLGGSAAEADQVGRFVQDQGDAVVARRPSAIGEKRSSFRQATETEDEMSIGIVLHNNERTNAKDLFVSVNDLNAAGGPLILTG